MKKQIENAIENINILNKALGDMVATRKNHEIVTIAVIQILNTLNDCKGEFDTHTAPETGVEK